VRGGTLTGGVRCGHNDEKTLLKQGKRKVYESGIEILPVSDRASRGQADMIE
jgi:hypothetical protein